jgi:ribosomal protein S18 acetylase RimI-like enzyme
VNFTIKVAELENPAQAKALVEIIDSYARGPGGQNEPHSVRARSTLVTGLAEHPSATVLLAFVESEPVGTAVCLWGFSTFAGMPSVNIQDLAVLPAFQRRGIGRALLAGVERRARERGCCRITLEVHDTNEGAKGLYRSAGFGPWDPPTLFVTKRL